MMCMEKKTTYAVRQCG